MTARATIDTYIADWNSHDTEAILAYFTPDAVYEDAAIGVVNNGAEELRHFLEAMYAALPDISFTVSSAQGDESVIAWEWTLQGHYEKDFPDLPPGTAHGQPVTLRGASITRYENGKVVRNTDYWNLAAMLVQIGVLPPPA